MSLGIRLANPLHLDDALKLANPIALATHTPNVIAQRAEDTPGLVSYQFELQEGYWQSYTRADVTGLGVGLSERRRQVEFSFDRAPHTLVAGETNCGKSVTVGSILTGLCSVYTPDDLRLVLIDPDSDYAAFERVVNLVLPIAHEVDEIDRALAWVGQELARRRDSNIKDAYRLLVVVDEAEETLDDARLEVVTSLAKGGRKFKVHLLIASQKPTQGKLPDILDQLGSRYVGKCDNAQTSVLLTGHAGLQAHKLTQGGDFLHIDGTIERFQVAMATKADYDRLERSETVWPTIEAEDTPRVLNFFPNKEAGRREVEIDPRRVAYYVHYGVDGISMGQAEESLGLKRRAHERHRAFAADLINELEVLRNG